MQCSAVGAVLRTDVNFRRTPGKDSRYSEVLEYLNANLGGLRAYNAWISLCSALIPTLNLTEHHDRITWYSVSDCTSKNYTLNLWNILFSNYCLTVSYLTWGFVFLLYRQVFSCCLGMNILSAFSYSQYQRMLSTLSQCEFSMGKTLLVYDMNLREMENYEKIYKDIGKDEKILFVFCCCCC